VFTKTLLEEAMLRGFDCRRFFTAGAMVLEKETYARVHGICTAPEI
jgi:hypothetical protein